MINVNISQAFNELDVEETSNSYQYHCQPIKCALEDEPSRHRCVSLDSDNTIDLDERDLVSGASGDLFDDYKVFPTVLGTGNYGCVRECLHRATGKRYAVKTIEKAMVARRDHIRREIRLLRSLDHPNIISCVDCYEDEAYVHIVTEKYGSELFDEIVASTSAVGCLPERRAATIVKAILEAVQYLHRRDIVHRDIKPENVLFASTDKGASVKLIDFGLARTHGLRDGAMRTQVGTAYYMSPGVLKGRYNRSCDIWAVGVLTYTMLCGYPPFNGTSDQEVHASTLRGNLVFEKGVWRHLSKTSRGFVKGILGRNLQNITSVEEALQHPWIASA